ncbi:sodium:glutamate symporter [Rhodococcus sp. G-MC3]|uniref:sodium/glutamate symporter n=1 Tax=Rhodococcus sp. G-MC3 TaxID=3046209 RepID=UPI0024BA167B|nr:sodium:glutamate symporter [Rhodococcus sp. G-MC3]MDJ0396456.1 sodium:glutamate symporter [Rhodococcus sp. G-MC3]
MNYTPYTLLADVGWISVLLLVGLAARRCVPPIQRLMLPSSITAGLLGICFGPAWLDVIPFSDQLSTYSSVLIAVVFAAIPYSEGFGGVARGARTMWSYSVGMYVLQWGTALLFSFAVLGLFFTLPAGFGLVLPAGWAGGFGTAAAVGGTLEDAGFEGATSLGFTSATAGVFVCIIGGLAIAKWGAARGKTAHIGAYDQLPAELRTGLVEPEERSSLGSATTSPSSLESLAAHLALLAATTYIGYLITMGVKVIFPSVSVPVFAAAFLVGFVGRLLLHLTPGKRFVDGTTITSISGSTTDYLVAFGIASIVPTVVASYALPLLLLMLFGLVYCVLMFRYLTPRMFSEAWLERGLFC